MRIAHEMKGTKGSIMYDGWTRNGTNYIGIYALYVKARTILLESVENYHETVQSTLISVSPIALESDNHDKYDSAADTKETNSFKPEVHVKHFGSVSEIFGLEF